MLVNANSRVDRGAGNNAASTPTSSARTSTWSGRYGHLREITRDDVAAVLAGSGLLFGSRRRPQGHGAATGLPRGGYLAPWHPWVKRP